MIYYIYDAPDSSVKPWPELRVGVIVDALDWSYEKLFCGVGTFELYVPIGAEGADKLKLNRLLMSNDGEFIIKQLQYGADSIKVSGYDLNGLLLDRLTVAKTEDGKDKVKGSTESIVKHFVDVNCASSEDAGRNFPGLTVEPNNDRGIADDAASPRLECVADVISDILSAQQMGWRISAINTHHSDTVFKDRFRFYVYEAVDRTWEQNKNSPKTFSYGLGNANSIKTENSIAGSKNTLYCELTDGTVQIYSPVSDNAGFGRTEEYADLGCELSELSIYAEHEIAGRFGTVRNVTLEHIDSSGYRSKLAEGFDLGDIVTVVDDHANIQLEALITSVKIKRSGNEFDLAVTIGEARIKPIDRVSKSVGAVSSSVKSASVKGESNKLVFSDGSSFGIDGGNLSGTGLFYKSAKDIIEFIGYLSPKYDTTKTVITADGRGQEMRTRSYSPLMELGGTIELHLTVENNQDYDLTRFTFVLTTHGMGYELVKHTFTTPNWDLFFGQ